MRAEARIGWHWETSRFTGNAAGTVDTAFPFLSYEIGASEKVFHRVPAGCQLIEDSAVPPSVLEEVVEVLCQANVFRLQTLRAFFHYERHARAFVERAISAGFDSGEMDENVFAIFTLDESEAFCGVKPLHGTCFFHVSSTSSYDAFLQDLGTFAVARIPSPDTLQPLDRGQTWGHKSNLTILGSEPGHK